MYYNPDPEAKAGSSERKRPALPRPAVDEHTGNVQDGERTVDVGKHESVEKEKRNKLGNWKRR